MEQNSIHHVREVNLFNLSSELEWLSKAGTREFNSLRKVKKQLSYARQITGMEVEELHQLSLQTPHSNSKLRSSTIKLDKPLTTHARTAKSFENIDFICG